MAENRWYFCPLLFKVDLCDLGGDFVRLKEFVAGSKVNGLEVGKTVEIYSDRKSVV